MKICIVEGCEKRQHVKLGYCGAHYRKYKKYGDPLAGRQNLYAAGETPDKCTIDGCDGKYAHGGLCQAHYLRKKKLGSPGALYPSETEKACSVDGCDGEHYSKSYCSKHYQQWFNHGDPLHADSNTPLAWLARHVDHDGDDCLIWPHSGLVNGYGTVAHGDRKRIASRVMCELAHGEPPEDGMQAAHSCGNGHGGCVNPQHLRWATVKENADDRREHGTLLHGEDAPWSKLTARQVEHIILSDGVESRRDLADRFGVSPWTIRDIRAGRIWRRVHGELHSRNRKMDSKV